MQTENFILHKQGVFGRPYCERVVEQFERSHRIGNTISRQQNNEGYKLRKDDFAYFPFQETDARSLDILSDFNQIFWPVVYGEYVEKFQILNDHDKHSIWTHKVQKTSPGQGYHIWHTENMGRNSCNRLLTYILFLNDVEDGGETEFLYYGLRVKPKAGDVLLWPAGFTHTHRGNPPLSGDKYIMTGWVEY